MNEHREKETHRKPLQRKSSTPLPSSCMTRPSLPRRLSFPERSEATWATLPTISYSLQQEFHSGADDTKSSISSTPQYGMMKLPRMDGREEQNCQDLGHKKLVAFSKTKPQIGRRPSLPDSLWFTTKPNLTSQGQCISADEECTSLPRQFLWSTDRQVQSKALQQFLQKADATFDSNKEKAKILCNWMSSQTSQKQS